MNLEILPLWWLDDALDTARRREISKSVNNVRTEGRKLRALRFQNCVFIMLQAETKLRECLPLETVDEILNWESCEANTWPAAAQLLENLPDNEGCSLKSLVCHDMKGGYLDDRFFDGTSYPSNYCFWHWDVVDIFVYFSHKLLTIPPIGWINAAHRHGVSVLGTFITEWDAGAVICERIFSDLDVADKVAENMALIAAYYGFEGYLINLENGMTEKLVGGVLYFVKKLRSMLKSQNGRNLVIWYDSVVTSGKLDWQNELNASNYPFFEASDGIFLNYVWKEQNLQVSVQTSGNRSFDVYVGIDVFGRGCYECGGWNTWKAAELIRKFPLSVAVFAPGWVFEHFEDDFHRRQNEFWNQLTPYLRRKSRKHQLPVMTSFCKGFGYRKFKNGQICGQSFFNLSEQNVQPLLYSEEVCHHTNDAYHGGGCLKVSGLGSVIPILAFECASVRSVLFCCAYKLMSTPPDLSDVLEPGNQVEAIFPENLSDAGVELRILENGEMRFCVDSPSSDEACVLKLSPIENDMTNELVSLFTDLAPGVASSWSFRIFHVQLVEPISLTSFTVQTSRPILLGLVSLREIK